jgi:serine/threonine-protein kinase
LNSSDKTNWQQVKTLFKAARALPVESRADYLQEQCGDDSAMRAEVFRLLQSETSDDYLVEIVQVAAKDTVAAAAVDKIEHRVGNYKLIELVGTGGMGNVYRAERDDHQFDHQVAIKILHAHLGDEGMVQRFQIERQTLANLDHPNIARLLDGGETEDNAPYLVMEYVDGVPIDTYCDEHRLSVRQRLHLFQKVCAAVDYAHRNLIVHRDIKPLNILVNKSGEPKLLDFGIAKFVDSAALSYAVTPTREGNAALTPEFASPEQVRGEAITTATDVYSLGVLLYILLSGRRPYLQQATNMAAIAKAICDIEPSRPSTVITLEDGSEDTAPEIVAFRRTSIGKLTRLLSGDLDNIVMKALQKEPERRYSSARMMSDDIDNYLSDAPVAARPDTLLYRAGKFVRRNRWGVATGVLILMLIVGFPAYYSVQVTEQRDLANQEAQKAARVSEFMLSLFSTPDPDQAQGELVTARSLLDQGALRIEEDLADQPAVRAAMQDVMGGAYLGLGLYEQSEKLLGNALQTRVSLYGDEHVDVLQTATRISSLATSKGDFQESESRYREALELSSTLLGEDSVSAAMLLSGLANAVYEQGRQEEARSYYEEALSMHDRLSPDPSREKATTMHGFGWLLTNMAEFESAEAMLRASVAMLRETAGTYHPEVPAAMNHLTFALMDSGQWDAAEMNMREGLALTTRIYGEEHPSVSGDLFTFGTILQRKGNYVEAEQLYRRGLAIDSKLLGEAHPYIASDKNNLAGVLRLQGKYGEAVVLYRESLALNESAFGREHPETATNISNLGLTYLQLGDFEAARDLLMEATRIRTDVLGADHPATLSSNNIYAIYLRLIEDFEAARSAFRESLENRTRVLGEMHTGTINTALGLGELLIEMELLDDAAAALALARTMAEENLDVMHPIRIRTTLARAALAEGMNDTESAALLYADALDRYRQLLLPGDPRLARALIPYGNLLASTGDESAALLLLEEAVKIREAVLPEGHWEIAVALSALGSVQSSLGLSEAYPNLQQARNDLLLTRGAANSHTIRAEDRLAEHRATQIN